MSFNSEYMEEMRRDDGAMQELEEECYYELMELVAEISEKAGDELALRVASHFGLEDDFIQERYGFKPVSLYERMFP